MLQNVLCEQPIIISYICRKTSKKYQPTSVLATPYRYHKKIQKRKSISISKNFCFLKTFLVQEKKINAPKMKLLKLWISHLPSSLLSFLSIPDLKVHLKISSKSFMKPQKAQLRPSNFKCLDGKYSTSFKSFSLESIEKSFINWFHY
jgi:hypothetical protein